jgi:hypothetical protein
VDVFEAEVNASFDIGVSYRVDLLPYGDVRSALANWPADYKNVTSFGEVIASSLVVENEEFRHNSIIFRGNLTESDVPVQDGQAILISEYIVIDYSGEIIVGPLAYGILQKQSTTWLSPET